MGVFEIVEAGFLPVGHTHEDIDQCFSQTSTRLRNHSAISLTDMHRELSHTNMEKALLHHMKRLVNWSGLCDSKKCLRKIDNITQDRYYRFSKGFNNQLQTVQTYTLPFVMLSDEL